MTATLLGLALAVGAPGAKDDPKKEGPSLVGEWVPSTAVRGGKPDMPPAGSTITFTVDGKLMMKEGTQAKADEGGYKIDAKKNPAEIDITPPAGDKGPMIVGIYKFERDSLILCLALGGTRPTKFESPEGSETMLITLQRVKKE
jgi:uncharacterized protein (TIGR03067 family)